MLEIETKPSRIIIFPDDYHAKFVGKTKDLKQFFLTTPFGICNSNEGKRCEFISLYIWDKDGNFLEAKIDKLGPLESLNEIERSEIFYNRIKELGEIVITYIEIEPFEINKFGQPFGLIYSKEVFEGQDEPYETIELHPGNYMAFTPPWDGGYDT